MNTKTFLKAAILAFLIISNHISATSAANYRNFNAVTNSSCDVSYEEVEYYLFNHGFTIIEVRFLEDCDSAIATTDYGSEVVVFMDGGKIIGYEENI